VTSKSTRFPALAVGLFLTAAVGYAASGSSANTEAKQALAAIDTDLKSLVSEPVGKAETALKRAADARAAGDEKHALLLDDLALELAGTAADLIRSAELEKKASTEEQAASETEANAVRAVAIIEEAVARKGRAQDQLDQQKAAGVTEPPSAGEPKP